MKTFLLNGCSYATTPNFGKSADLLRRSLGYDNFVNLSRSASSNDRIYRTTLQYLLENPVDFVMISTTFWSRNEAPWAESVDIEGSWISYSSMGVPYNLHEKNYQRVLIYDKKNIDNYVKLRTLIDWSEEYTEKSLYNLVMFTSVLDTMSIPYCLFDSADGSYKYVENIPLLNYINRNKKIIDITNWSMNKFLVSENAVSPETELSIYHRHYLFDDNIDAYAKLTRFLSDYILLHCV